MYPLLEGEELLWSGRPQRFPRRFRNYRGYLVWTAAVVSLLALAFAAAVATHYPPFEMMASVYPVFVIVLLLIAERERQRKALFAVLGYQVTSRRIVFTAERGEGFEVRWVWLADLRAPRVREHGDGTGAVDFRPTLAEYFRDGRFRTQSSLLMMLPELAAIEDAERVAGLIETAGAGLRSAS